jgi:hemerythrin-like domain-containing protein
MPIHVMRAEHERLREELRVIEQALRAGEPTWRAAIHDIEETLKAHNQKEERVLYPWADQTARDQSEVRALSANLAEVLNQGA